AAMVIEVSEFYMYGSIGCIWGLVIRSLRFWHSSQTTVLQCAWHVGPTTLQDLALPAFRPRDQQKRNRSLLVERQFRFDLVREMQMQPQARRAYYHRRTDGSLIIQKRKQPLNE